MTGQMMPDRPSRPFRIPKKIAMINDIAGYGRCSTTVSLPIISAMQVQVCPVPTSIFSNHTGFPVHFMHDCTDILPEYLEKWRELRPEMPDIPGYLPTGTGRLLSWIR